MASKIPKDAPQLTDRPRSDYPLRGVKTGPAWRAAWALLRNAHPEFVAASVIAEQVTKQHPDISPDTVKNLLLSAHRYGVLDKRYEMLNSRNQAHYRIKV